jgi:predicted DNA-binding transcriptional regulator AlpA
VSDLREQILASLQPPDVDSLSDAVIEALARRLAPCMTVVRSAAPADGWLDFDGALEHLGMKRGTLYKLTSARTIPFHQDGPGCKLWFLRSELDEWRLNSGARKPRSTHLRAA